MVTFSDRSSTGEDEGLLEGEPVLDLRIADPRSALAHCAPDVREAISMDGGDARETIARALARDGILDPSRVVLAPSAGAAHAALLALLCDPGDEVLVPAPAALPIAHAAHLLGVALSRYALRSDDRFALDAGALWDAIGERTRAIVLESPSPASGALVSRDEHEALAALGIARIADESHAFFVHSGSAPRALAFDETLVFSIGSLEWLPGAGVAWIAAGGPEREANEAIARLSAIAEAFFAVPSIVHGALDALFAIAAREGPALIARARANLALLTRALEGSSIELAPIEAGLRVPLRLPTGRSGDGWARHLAAHGLFVDAGARYGFPDEEPWVLAGLLTAPDVLERGAGLLRELAR